MNEKMRLLIAYDGSASAKEALNDFRIARCPVERRDLPIRILIGLDGSGGAQTVVNQVALRTWPAGSEAFIVALDEDVKPTEEMKVRELIAVVEEDLRAVAGLRVSSEIAESDWEKDLIAEARSFGADCIFVCSGISMDDHDVGHPGIVSAALLSGAPCSVEIVRQQQAGH